MFGIIYTLLGLGAYGKGLVKQGIHDANNAQEAIKSGSAVYIDARGKTREVGTNELVYYPDRDPLTGDSGYTIIEPKSERLHQFVNLAQMQRDAEWKGLHEELLKNGIVYKDGKNISVIDFESKDSKLDREGTYWRPYEYKDIKIPTRPCKGHRFKDIKTGRVFVKRDLPVGEWDQFQKKYRSIEFFMDIESGLIVRETDGVVAAREKWLNKHPGDPAYLKIYADAVAETKMFIKTFNANQTKKREAGLREQDPEEFYKNLYSVR